MLIDTLPEELSGDVLDMGCGYGVIGVAVGKHWPDCAVTMADINQRACALSMENARKNGVNAQVLESDGYEKVLGRSNPSVGLVNMGTDESKGTTTLKAAHELLEKKTGEN